MKKPATAQLACRLASALLLIATLSSSEALGRTSNPLCDVPSDLGNTRFFSDMVSEVMHPSLSLNGFDCGPYCDKGLGLKQVLENLFFGSNESKYRVVYRKLRNLATDNSYELEPDSRSQTKENTQILQARAFIALATYVLEQNGHDPVTNLDPELSTHAEAMTLLRDALLDTDSWEMRVLYLDSGPEDIATGDVIIDCFKDEPGACELAKDAVRWATVIDNMSRAMDLYLALENAYCYYGDSECNDTTSDVLLSQGEKENVFDASASSLRNMKLLSDASITLFGLTPPGWLAGNWPLKARTSIGYGILAAQDVPGGPGFYSSFHRALEVNFGQAGNNRGLFWGYQTDDGMRFWAEGPDYFQFALTNVIPFWHAVRINDMLDYHPDPNFHTSDPFVTDRFTDPIDWLADIVTPDGRVPAVDDGNRDVINAAPLLRWTSNYGDRFIGKKFAWISGQSGGFGAKDDLLPVEIAIPRVSGSAATPPAYNVGNDASFADRVPKDDDEQQLIARRSDKDDNAHYLYLHGESAEGSISGTWVTQDDAGDAIKRGETHEQADNMQLLYHVDDASYLMDSGYDGGLSTWDDYWQHNVLNGPPGGGGDSDYRGIRAPRYPYETGLERMLSDHTPVSRLYRTSDGNISMLHAEQRLLLEGDSFAEILDDNWLIEDNFRSRYRRDVLFVEGDDPYLIDLNRNKVDNYQVLDNEGSCYFRMRYHIDSDESVDASNFNTYSGGGYSGGRFLKWSGVRNAEEDLYIYPMAIEFPLVNSSSREEIKIRYDDSEEEEDNP